MLFNKSEVLKNALECFHIIENPDSKDYLTLFQAVHMCLKQGDGLGWGQVSKIVKDVLDDTDYSFTKLGETHE